MTHPGSLCDLCAAAPEADASLPLLSHISFGLDVLAAEVGPSVAESDSSHHPIAIEGMQHQILAYLELPMPITKVCALTIAHKHTRKGRPSSIGD